MGVIKGDTTFSDPFPSGLCYDIYLEVAKTGFIKGHSMLQSSEERPQKGSLIPRYYPRFLFVFHFLFHLTLQYWPYVCPFTIPTFGPIYLLNPQTLNPKPLNSPNMAKLFASSPNHLQPNAEERCLPWKAAWHILV